MIYATDEISLKKIARDKFGDETVTTTTWAVRVENNSRVMPGPNGQELRPELLVMAPSGFTGIKGDRIIVSKLRGAATGETREREILEVFKAGGFGVSHLEVMA